MTKLTLNDPELKKQLKERLKSISTPAKPKTQKERFQEINLIIIKLCRTFPKAFDLKNPKPLKMGIFDDICAVMKDHKELDGLSKTQVRKAISSYAVRQKYFKTFVESTHRVNLQGGPVQEILQEHKEHARARLK